MKERGSSLAPFAPGETHESDTRRLEARVPSAQCSAMMDDVDPALMERMARFKQKKAAKQKEKESSQGTGTCASPATSEIASELSKAGAASQEFGQQQEVDEVDEVDEL